MDEEAALPPPCHCLFTFLQPTYLPTSHCLSPSLFPLLPAPTFHILVPNDCSQSSASWGFCWQFAVFGTSTLPLTPHSDCFREKKTYTLNSMMTGLHRQRARHLFKVSYYLKQQAKIFGSRFFQVLKKKPKRKSTFWGEKRIKRLF